MGLPRHAKELQAPDCYPNARLTSIVGVPSLDGLAVVPEA